MENQVGDIIRKVLRAKKLTQQQFADQIGVSNSSVNQWITGRTRIAQENLLPVAQALGMDVADLLAGRMPDQLRPTTSRALALSTIAVPYVPGKAGVQFVDCIPQTEQTYPVLERAVDPQATYMVMQVDGHAMESELRDGSTVLAELVPTDQLPFESGGIYAVQFAGRLVIRRIRANELRERKQLVLHADNENYSNITVLAGELECAWRVISILYQPVR